MMMKKILMWLPLVAVSFFSCSDNSDIKVEGLTLSREEIQLYLMTGTELPALIADIQPSNATDKSVVWESDSPDIISVDQAGNLTLVDKTKEGKVVISVTSGNAKASCTITIANNFKELGEAGYGFIDVTKELGMYVMDRNLGATEVYSSATKSAASIGNYYQWGKNTPVANGADVAVNAKFDKEWNGAGANFSDWSVAANTPCPAGWVIPNQAQMKKITDGAWADYDGFSDQTKEEFEAAKALYKKLLIARGGYWRIQGADAAARSAATPDKYLSTAGYLWSAEKNALDGTSTRGFNRAYTLSDNYDIMMGKKGGENELSNAMPIRCIKVVQ